MSTLPARVAVAGIRDEPLDQAGLAAMVDDHRAGATVTFTGVVRNHDAGRAVEGIEYVGHPSAGSIIAEVADEFVTRDGVHAIAVEHRVGMLRVGDLALVAAVSASHRSQAFSTCSDLVDRIKQRLPIWKRQQFGDGTAEWSNCP
ncbi:MAG TPA: molybdenum cofactor biosynthesis protein MoaE [Micropruina sp.]|mgnify:FL=1|jgi:molybdopterin synthase catalytic subunit|nr:molybdenum cofactor biosynthesis protein MoaE [Micropruina sp.]